MSCEVRTLDIEDGIEVTVDRIRRLLDDVVDRIVATADWISDTLDRLRDAFRITQLKLRKRRIEHACEAVTAHLPKFRPKPSDVLIYKFEWSTILVEPIINMGPAGIWNIQITNAVSQVGNVHMTVLNIFSYRTIKR